MGCAFIDPSSGGNSMARDQQYQAGTGTVVQVFKTDRNGFPTNHVERDSDGQHFHIVAGKRPVAIDADEVQSVGAESSQSHAGDRKEDEDDGSQRG